MLSGRDPYTPAELEPRVQRFWKEADVYRTLDDTATPREKRCYVLDMFPYPSGEGLHVGHVEGYTASDIYARYLRMRGYDVLHPMGWDAFGLPAENAAIQQKTHPRKLVEKNVARFREQLQRVGFSYDWSREIITTDPDYYRWTQWIFLKLFHLGLAYEAQVLINWCPSCKTGLANEEVVDGGCERCGTQVTKRGLRQWLLRITKYADRLLRDLDQLDWPAGIQELQRNWIGRSEGTEVVFQIPDSRLQIPVFTTRADTLFGATYLVLAPEHPLVGELLGQESCIKNQGNVRRYIEEARGKSDLERTALEQEKTGVPLVGVMAVNPVNAEAIPVWVADYVLASYGTGAIMAVPAHDERDFAFAKKYGLPIRRVVQPSAVIASGAGGGAKQSPGRTAGGIASAPAPAEQWLEPRQDDLAGAFVDDGILVNSGEFTSLSSAEARDRITEWLKERGSGRSAVNYKLRDWVFSRQRYWGEPIPMIHCDACGVVPVPEDQLPVLLPDVDTYEPTGTGESPLAAIESWVRTTCPQCGKPARRETNTMPQWAGSCWYFLRFLEPANEKEFVSWAAVERWMPVDLYIGGAEHAVLHLLYARFWVKALSDAGYVPLEEPFQRLRNQGTILGPDGQKMSKSRGNVVNPDDIIAQYGADTLRLYEMFLGPLESVKPWDPKAVPGAYRFLRRVWRLGSDLGSGVRGRESHDPRPLTPDSVRRALHRLIKKVGEDIEALKFNTAIAAMMEFVNLAEKEGIGREDFKTFLIVLSPFAPHLAEELWQKLEAGGWRLEAGGGRIPGSRIQFPGSITQQVWPTYDPTLVEETEVTVIVQVDGRVRDEVRVPRDADEATVRAAAENRAKARTWLQGKQLARVVFVKNRLLNFVTR